MSKADPRIREIHEALESGRLGEAIEQAVALVAAAETEDLRLKAHALAGMGHFHLGDYGGALPHFQATAAGMPSRPAWLRVAMAATLSGRIEEGAQAFQAAVDSPGDTPESRDLSVAFMVFDHVGALLTAGRPDLALKEIERIGPDYQRAGTSDDERLLAMGLPLLSHYVNLVLEIHDQLHDRPGARRWARSFAAKLDAKGRRIVDEVGRGRGL